MEQSEDVRSGHKDLYKHTHTHKVGPNQAKSIPPLNHYPLTRDSGINIDMIHNDEEEMLIINTRPVLGRTFAVKWKTKTVHC